jgi:hypothetical protein
MHGSDGRRCRRTAPIRRAPRNVCGCLAPWATLSGVLHSCRARTLLARFAKTAVLVAALAGLAGCGNVVVDGAPGASSAGTGSGGSADAGTDVPPQLILASTSDALYTIQYPVEAHAAVHYVGMFEGCEDVTDLAMSGAGKLYATTTTGLYTVDPVSAACTLVAMGAYPDSLAFIPPGAADPVAEALVGYLGASYVRIDPSTGVMTTLGVLGSDLSPGGDLAADPDGNVFVVANGASCNSECLVRVNPETGALVEVVNPSLLGTSALVGLAYANGALYDVNDAGELCVVEPDAVEICPSFTVEGGPAPTSYTGATTEP